MEALLVVAIVIAFMVPYSIYVGAVLAALWGWFIVPLGVQPIGIAHAVGLAVFIGMFHRGKAKSKEGALESLLLALLAPALALGVGYIAKGFMA
jgi:hypothetical protein